MKPKGIKIFGIVLIVTSLFELNTLFTTFEYYKKLFEPMPEQIYLIRFTGSVILRALGFISGVGILCRKDIFRKLAIAISIFTIITIYWKHPYYVVSKFCQPFIDRIYLATANPIIQDPLMVKFFIFLVLIILCTIDIAFSVVLIYYFTRPYVEQEFK